MYMYIYIYRAQQGSRIRPQYLLFSYMDPLEVAIRLQLTTVSYSSNYEVHSHMRDAFPHSRRPCLLMCWWSVTARQTSAG